MTSQVRSKIITESSQKRNISFILGVLFILGFVIPIYRNWKISQKVKLTPQIGATISDISFYCEYYNDSLKSSDNYSYDEVVKYIIPSILKSEAAKKLNDKVNRYDRAKQIKLMDLFWNSKIAFFKNNNNIDINKSNLFNIYSNLIDNISHEENLTKVMLFGLKLLPYERFLNFGEAKYQSIELEPVDIEIDDITDEEIENYYAKNLNSFYRTNATCKFRYALIGDKTITNKPRPESINMNEIKEYLRKHDEIWEVEARRCFRYLAMGKNYIGQKYKTEDFNNLNSNISLESKKDLPSEFADKLFSLKHGEIATNLDYGGTKYAIQYLFEIPKTKLSLEQALNIAKLRCYGEKAEKQKKDIIEALRIMPKSYPKFTKESIDNLFSSSNWELEWKHLDKNEIEYENVKSIFKSQEFPKSASFYLNKLFEDKLKNTSEDDEDNQLVNTDEKYYFINENNSMIVELSDVKKGYVEPIAKVKQNIKMSIFEQKQKDKLLDIVKNKSKKLIIIDQEDNDLMGSDKSSSLLSVLVANKKINSSIKNEYSNEDEFLDYELKQSKIINALHIPKKEKCIYALINDTYSENGNWQIVKYERKEIQNNTKQSLENEEITEVTEEKKNGFYSTEIENIMSNIMHIWLVNADNVDKLNEESDNLYNNIEKYCFSNVN